ncbi:MAG: hypothetical protein ACSHXF_01470 [Aquaticitalea sp.]
MKFSIVLFVSFILGLSLSAQDNSINLPDINMKVGMIVEPNYDIYVTKNKHIIFEKDTVNLNEINKLLYQSIKGYGVATVAYMQKQIHLFADRDLEYRLIDDIKTEISSTNSSKYIIYRSSPNSNNGRGINGIKHKSPLSYFSVYPPEYIKTKKQIKTNDSIIKEQEYLISDFPEIPSSSDSNWKIHTSVERIIYSVQKEIIEGTLRDKIFECLTISNAGLINTEKKIITKSDLKKLLLKNDILFLKYNSDLTYGNYLNAITILQELKPNFGSNMNYAEVIELSYQIQKLHDEVGVVFCD